jgi:hypothetical protein
MNTSFDTPVGQGADVVSEDVMESWVLRHQPKNQDPKIGTSHWNDTDFRFCHLARRRRHIIRSGGQLTRILEITLVR